MKGLLGICILFFTTNHALAQADAAAGSAVTDLSLFGLIAQGGWAMWPLGLCSLFMLFLIALAWRETSASRFLNPATLPVLSEKFTQRDMDGARALLEAQGNVMGRSLLGALGKARPERPDANKEKVELYVAESLEAEENGISQWINYLNVVATVAPMIGLLGTVSGMISAFQTISFGGMGKPELLAGDIGEALITTATGLVIGIPAMIAYFVFKNRLSSQMIATAQTASNLIDDLAGD